MWPCFLFCLQGAPDTLLLELSDRLPPSTSQLVRVGRWKGPEFLPWSFHCCHTLKKVRPRLELAFVCDCAFVPACALLGPIGRNSRCLPGNINFNYKLCCALVRSGN